MSNEERVKKLERPFKAKFPPVLFVESEDEIPEARKQWEKEHGRGLGEKERVQIFIQDMQD